MTLIYAIALFILFFWHFARQTERRRSFVGASRWMIVDGFGRLIACGPCSSAAEGERIARDVHAATVRAERGELPW